MEPDTSRAIGARQGSGPSHMLPTLTVNLSARAHSLLAETGIATAEGIIEGVCWKAPVSLTVRNAG